MQSGTRLRETVPLYELPCSGVKAKLILFKALPLFGTPAEIGLNDFLYFREVCQQTDRDSRSARTLDLRPRRQSSGLCPENPRLSE